MLTDVLSGAKFCRQLRNGDWEVQTQTNPDIYVLHRVFPLLNQTMCTCWDFRKNSEGDDSFECKHILLVDLVIDQDDQSI